MNGGDRGRQKKKKEEERGALERKREEHRGARKVGKYETEIKLKKKNK